MITFKKIRWKNLLSTGNEFTEILLNKTKTTLIIGENGAGKSTFLDALSFALYGKAFRNINKKQLVNTINGNHMVVEAEFAADGNDYLVRRGIKPDFFEIYKNEHLVDQQSAIRDYQTSFETEILKMNHKAFKQVVVLGSSDYVPFMALKSADRREVIEDIIDIQIFTVMSSMLKAHADRVKDNIRIVGNNLEQLKKTHEIHRNYLTSQEQTSQEQHDELVIEREQKQDLITSIGQEIEQHQQANVSRAEKVADQADVVKMLEELDDIRSTLNSRSNSLKREVQFLRENDECPTCTQEIHDEFKQGAITRRSADIVKMAEGITKINSRVSTVRNQLSEINETSNDIRASQTAIHNLTREVDFHQRQIEEIDRKIEQLDHNTQKKANTQLIADLARAIRNEAGVIEQLYAQNEVHEYGSILLKDTGIKARLLKKYIPIINQMINDFLHQMNFFIQFELDENFNETIKSTYRDTFTYSSFSEGEKLRINLAILFTWREIAKMRNSMSTNLLIMDEIFDSSLDDEGVEDFLKIIEEMTGETNIFVISHKSQMFDKFRGAIRFRKQGNFSKIASEGA